MTSFRAFRAVSAPPLSSLSNTATAFFPTRPNSVPQRRLCRFGVKCSYAEAGISNDSRSTTTDVVADIVVLGGNGFVGSTICKAAVSKGMEVISLSRSGRPTYSGSWVDQVTWIPGVVLRPGFIYGKRRVGGFELPLDLVGEPLKKILGAVENFTKPLNSLSASDLILAPQVRVDDVAYAVINAVRDDDFFGVFTIEQIKEAAAEVKV